MVLLMNYQLFSQTTILSDSGDTLICTTLPQSKFLIKSYYKSIELDSLLSISEYQIIKYKNINRDNSLKIKNIESLVVNKNIEIGASQDQIQILENNVNYLNKQVRKHKFQKKLIIVGSVITMGILGYYK